MTTMRVLLVDNFDSFVWNLAQAFGALGAEPEVVRNDAVDVDALVACPPDRIVLSPGPCGPAEAGRSVEVVTRLAARAPILGVCLGHQCIATAFGGAVVRAPKPVHGRPDDVHHDESGWLRGLRSPLSAARYHSLVVDGSTLPPDLIVTARTIDVETGDKVVMGVRHRDLPVEGVQFHPESFMTPDGPHLLRNFLEEPWTPSPTAC